MCNVRIMRIEKGEEAVGVWGWGRVFFFGGLEMEVSNVLIDVLLSVTFRSAGGVGAS